MNLNIVNYDTTRHSICWTYVFLRHDVVKEPQELCLKNQEISRNSRFLKKYNVKKWSRQEKRNLKILSWKSRQDKKCSLRQEILSW